jgi:hypothetical protein
MVAVLAIILVGTLGTAVALLVSTTEQFVVTLSLEVIGVTGVIAAMQHGNDRDQRRVDTYLRRVCDPHDDPEIDPQTDV